MKKTTSSILAAAVTGLLVGGVTSCKSQGDATETNEQMTADKHACKGMNKCESKGGCAAGDNGCSGKNSCEGKGGCATAEHHACAGQNKCSGQGGCASGDNSCAGKNSCEGKGGCQVPVNPAMMKK